MFYAAINPDGSYLAAGYGSKTKENLKEAIVKIAENRLGPGPHIERRKKMSLEDLCDLEEFRIEQSRKPFPELVED